MGIKHPKQILYYNIIHVTRHRTQVKQSSKVNFDTEVQLPKVNFDNNFKLTRVNFNIKLKLIKVNFKINFVTTFKL